VNELIVGLFKNLKRLLVAQQVVMLKVIKNLSSASNTLETLESVGTIELISDFLITNSKNAHYKVHSCHSVLTAGNIKSSIECYFQFMPTQQTTTREGGKCRDGSDSPADSTS
jgi:hypothetical protein